jgi:hypothetical protein
MALPEQFADARDNFSNANRTMEDGPSRRQGNCFGLRCDENGGDAPDQPFDCGTVGEQGRFQDYKRRYLARGNGATGVVRALHTERVDAEFAELGAQGGAKRPVARNYENDRHPRGEV